MTERYDARPEDQFSTVTVNQRDVTEDRLEKEDRTREFEDEERINRIARQKDADDDDDRGVGFTAAQRIEKQQ